MTFAPIITPKLLQEWMIRSRLLIQHEVCPPEVRMTLNHRFGFRTRLLGAVRCWPPPL